MNGFELVGNVQITLAVMLAFFTFASCLLSIATLSNAWRLRNVLVKWNEGRLRGYPLFATVFLGLSVILSAVSYLNGHTAYYPVMICYLLLSLNWVLSSYYMSKRYITDNGIVKNINDPSQTVAWRHIHDYIEHENEKGFTFVFMYARTGVRKNPLNYLRLELQIPRNKVHSFKKIIDHKLGRRFQQSIDDTFIKRQLNQ